MAWTIYIQPVQPWYCFQSDLMYAPERRDGERMGLFERHDISLSWNWNDVLRGDDQRYYPMTCRNGGIALMVYAPVSGQGAVSHGKVHTRSRRLSIAPSRVCLSGNNTTGLKSKSQSLTLQCRDLMSRPLANFPSMTQQHVIWKKKKITISSNTYTNIFCPNISDIQIGQKKREQNWKNAWKHLGPRPCKVLRFA